jgi:hypothetical protein
MTLLAALCVVFHCGAVPHPSVWLVYVDRAADPAITAGVRAIVEDGYLPSPGTLAGVSEATVLHGWYGALPYVTDADVQPLVRSDVDITLLVLPDDIHAEPPDARCSGCLYTSSYHQVTADGRRYAVVSGRIREPLRELGYPDDQPLALYDAAHELVEAATDAERADPCAPDVVVWLGMALPRYVWGGVCTGGR